PADAVAERVCIEPRAVAVGTKGVLPVAAEQHPHVHLVGAGLHPPEPGAEPGVPAAAVGALALEHRLALLGPQLPPRDIERDALGLRDPGQLPALPLARAPVPGPERALGDAQRVVGDDLRPVDPEGASEPATGRARTHRRLVAEEPRPGRLEPPGAGRAHQALA